MRKIKLPHDSRDKFKATKSKGVIDNFYLWLRAEIGISLDHSLDVSMVYSSKSFEKLLLDLLILDIKGRYPGLSKKKVETSASMEILNYSPSTRLVVPDDEIWIEI